MQHVTGRNIESARAQSVPLQGVTQAIPFYARDAWYFYDGGEGPLTSAALPTTNTFGFGHPNGASNGQAGVWNGTSGDSSNANGGKMEWSLLLDDQFAADGDVKTPQIIARIRAGKSGSGTDNTDLAIVCTASVAVPGSTPVAVAAETITLSAKVTGGNHADLDEYDFNIGKLARESSVANLLTQGAMLFLQIEPNEAVGTNINLSIDGGQWILNRHDGLASGKTRLGRRS